MRKTQQTLLALAVVFALASIGFTLGKSITGKTITTSSLDLGVHLSCMSMVSVAVLIIIVIISIKKSSLS